MGFEKYLAEELAAVHDLGRVQAALVRERVIRNTMAQTGEGRQTVVDMIDALDSMDQEAVLDLTEGEPTTLVDALRRYLDELEKRDELQPRDRILEELGAILAFPWSEEEALVSLHNPHYGLALYVGEEEDRDLVVRMGNNRHEVARVNWEDAGSGGQLAARQVAAAVYRATLARVIPDRDHHVDLSQTDRDALVAWLAAPSGSITLGRLTLNAGGPAGVIVKTRPYTYVVTTDKTLR
jgi:hypothetical protein